MSLQLIPHLALQLVPGIGNATAKQLIGYVGDAQSVFEVKKKDLSRIPGIGEKTCNAILKKSTFDEAEKIILRCMENGYQLLHFTHTSYPERLKSIYDAPNILYFKGQGDLNAQRIISVVGTRKATDYGLKVTNQLVKDLATLGSSTVSGLAYGIDIECHRKSLEYNIPTFAVLAGGLDMIYPRQHLRTSKDMQEMGGIVSEYPPGTKPEAHLFPARNRIIAGLSDATVVVEAGSKGGALITAYLADGYERPVFAVPGNIDQPFSKGCNRLISTQKALAYTSIENLVYYLNWDRSKESRKKVMDWSKFSEEEIKVYQCLEKNPNGLPIDQLSWQINIPVNKLASLLLEMEIKGCIKNLPGNRFMISDIY
jgi:DNA processing protein